jgi:hypothetical protein
MRTDWRDGAHEISCTILAAKDALKFRKIFAPRPLGAHPLLIRALPQIVLPQASARARPLEGSCSAGHFRLWPEAEVQLFTRYVGNWGQSGRVTDIVKTLLLTQCGHFAESFWALSLPR